MPFLARRERGCLTHDDRVDALAGAVSYLQNTLMQDVNEAVNAMREAEQDAELEAFICAHERMEARDGRLFVVGAPDDDEEYVSYSYRIH